MVLWSSLRPVLTSPAVKTTLNGVVLRKMSGHKTFDVQPSRWHWNKFKDLLHFYLMIGIIPISIGVTLTNVFVGPATLEEIPEYYEPKYWEYYRHPITRFMARYIQNNPQQDYEKQLHFAFEEEEKRKIRKLESEIRQKMEERADYQAYYYRPILGQYVRQSREAADYLKSLRGD